MSLVLNVEILGEFKKLTAATTGAQSDLQRMSGQATKVSKGISKAFAAIGIGLSFRVIANELEDATKAAIEDRKSQELLALAMTNTGKATDQTIASAEKYIQKMMYSAGVADDNLRPAYQKLFIATGNVTESNKLLSIALDASAATGKDLDTVSQAMAKSLAGNDAALAKLIPSLKGSKTPIDDMAAAFAGASEKASNLDPYQKMQVVFGEIQERVGTALLPVLDDFAKWMSSPPGQATLQEIADAAANVLTELKNVATWAIANKDWLLPLVAGVGAVKTAATAIAAVTTAVNLATAAQDRFNLSVLRNPYVIAAGGVIAVGALGAAINSEPVQKESSNYLSNLNAQVPSANSIGIGGKTTTNNNVNINVTTPNATASDIIKKLDDYYKATGTRLSVNQ